MKRLISRIAAVFLLSFAANTASADLAALGWLARVMNASQNTSYTGEVIYQRGTKTEIVRITHIVDAKGEREHVETLEGPPRIVIRNNDQVFYLPQAIIAHSPRGPNQPFVFAFPRQLSEIGVNYHIKLGEQGRVAGREAREIILIPKDNLRYSHKLWADVQTGLLLKSSIMTDEGDTMDQFAFTDVNFDPVTDNKLFQIPVPPRTISRNTVRDLLKSTEETPRMPMIWQLDKLPNGFRKEQEIYRALPGSKGSAYQVIFSDGLAGVSAFVEPAGNASEVTQTSRRGAISMLSFRRNDLKITLIGEVPESTLKAIANAMQPEAE